MMLRMFEVPVSVQLAFITICVIIDLSRIQSTSDAVLIDVESDEPAPVVLNDPPREEAQYERLTELIRELDRQKKAREAAESSKSDLQAPFNWLKALAHEAIKKRNESKRERDEALKKKENLSKELESISGKVSSFKNFSNGGLPKSQKYTGLASVAYGVIKQHMLIRRRVYFRSTRLEPIAGADQKDLRRKFPKFIHVEDKALEKTWKVLGWKFTQLNSVMEDATSQLKTGDTPLWFSSKNR
ncbi:hypothetical protein DY000_02054764 [Brassica cretica]|uniref:Uncharacterized protein n=1 Tax=Brassica cretica TaxID=69181 RepID=A0ABQ7A497_BRACR|nr:hypothetical protein DY000_02054764 [Brassica cretica]